MENIKKILNENFKIITPNEKHDIFEKFIPLGDKKNNSDEKIFEIYSRGIETGRDAWCYNFSSVKIDENMEKTIKFFNEHEPTDIDETKISWTRATIQNKKRGKKCFFDWEYITHAKYRPFCEEFLYYDTDWNEMTYQMKKFFPTGEENNILICVSSRGTKNFSVFITDKICDLNFFDAETQCFPLYYWKDSDENSDESDLLEEDKDSYPCSYSFLDEYEFEEMGMPRYGISSFILNAAREKYGLSADLKSKNNFCVPTNITKEELFSYAEKLNGNLTITREKDFYRISGPDENITKEDIFYYVYGFLHLPGYQEKFSTELKKSLPRIFLVDSYEDFKKISKGGKKLAEIHLNYEKQPPPENVIVEGAEHGDFIVKKMKLSADKKILYYNDFITIKNIPEKIFEYVVNGRSPLEWIIDRYQVKIDKVSGIENNPNDWNSHYDKKYILNLILSSMTVSLKTLKILESLPSVNFEVE